MDWITHLRDTAAHLAWMAALPGELALEHARLRMRELVASGPMYADLARYVKEARREKVSQG